MQMNKFIKSLHVVAIYTWLLNQSKHLQLKSQCTSQIASIRQRMFG